MFSLAEIFAVVVRILNIVGQILGIAQLIQAFTQNAAQESLPKNIENIVTATSLNVASPVYGLSALNDTLTEMYDFLLSMASTLSADIAALPQVGDPVTLPTTPPAGYGGSIDATAVWTYPLASANSALSGDVLSQAGNMALNFGLAQTPIPSAFSAGILVYNSWQGPPLTSVASVPGVDTSTILSTDATVQAWWDRVNPLYPTQFVDSLGRPVFYDTVPSSSYFYIVDLPQWLFEKIRDGFGGTTANLPPIWPGIAKVTFHDDHAISGNLNVIDVPLDGIVISLDSVEAKAAYYDFGHRKSYKSLGLVSFYTDDSFEYEPAQPIGFEVGLVVPKTMKRAAGVSVLFFQDVTGFIYPLDFAT